jgi:hypothetical protein
MKHRDGLKPAVFIDAKVGRREAGDDMALPIGHRDRQPDEIRPAGEHGLTLGDEQAEEEASHR